MAQRRPALVLPAIRRALGQTLPLTPRFPRTGTEQGLAVALFPLVGLGVGALQALVLVGAREVWTPPIAAVLAWLVGVVLSLAELDGLADCGDAFLTQGLPRKQEDTLRILKDPHIGAMGGIALVAGLATELVVILQLDPARATAGLCCARLFGHWAKPAILFRGKPVHDKSTMKLWIENLRPSYMVATTGFAIVAGVAIAGPVTAGAMVAVAGAVVLGMRAIAMRKLGAIQGDVMGAAAYLTIIACLLVAAV